VPQTSGYNLVTYRMRSGFFLFVSEAELERLPDAYR
jgi:hypothetical protein